MSYNYNLTGNEYFNMLLSKEMIEKQEVLEQEFRKKYNELYSEDFLEYVAVVHDLDGEVYEFKPECYTFNEENEYVLKEECQSKLDHGLIRPSFDLWKEENQNETIVEDLIDKVVLLEQVKDFLKDKVQFIADEKQSKAEAYIAKKRNLTGKQIKRYRIKYNLALKAKETGNYEKFDLEAKLNNTTSESIVNAIIEKGELWEEEVDKFILLIDAIRGKIQDIIDQEVYLETDVNKIDAILSKADSFTANTTVEYVLGVFN